MPVPEVTDLPLFLNERYEFAFTHCLPREQMIQSNWRHQVPQLKRHQNNYPEMRWIDAIVIGNTRNGTCDQDNSAIGINERSY